MQGRVPSLCVGIATFLAMIGPAVAAPRDDVAITYADANAQADSGEHAAALRTLNDGIAAARRAGLTDDPSLAALHVMRAALLHALGRQQGDVYFACLQGVRIDPHARPPEALRSDDVEAICDRARAHVADPRQVLEHAPPELVADRDLELTATSKVELPEDGRMVLYWRRAGTEHYGTVQMQRLGNFGRVVVPSEVHRARDLEYCIYAFDAFGQTLGAAGSPEQPLRLSTAASPAPPPRRRPAPPRQTRRDANDPRVILSLGLGVGLGVAHGETEQTYRQFTDLDAYGEREQACAIARWFSGTGTLPVGPAEFGQALQIIGSAAPEALPVDAADPEAMQRLAEAYDRSSCAQRQRVSPRPAWSPLLVEPEIAVRVHRSVYVSAFARLQVIDGSRVYTDDPEKIVGDSLRQDVLSPAPEGVRRKPPLSWALGGKVKYFLGRARLRPFVGGFMAFGRARLRVPLGFSNDKNGNSVPDGRERAAVGPLDENGNLDPAQCVDVWPYRGCSSADSATLANAVRSRPHRERVDTVRLGPVVVGALGGVHFQATRHFALTAELQLGFWFPQNATVLVDLVAGPALTF